MQNKKDILKVRAHDAIVGFTYLISINFSNSSEYGFYLDCRGNCCTSNRKPIY